MLTFREWLEENHPEAVDESLGGIANRIGKGAAWLGDKAMSVAGPLSTLVAAVVGGYLGYNHGATFDFFSHKLMAAAMAAPMAGGIAHLGTSEIRDWLQDKMAELDRKYSKQN